jgi:hypothetical protein
MPNHDSAHHAGGQSVDETGWARDVLSGRPVGLPSSPTDACGSRPVPARQPTHRLPGKHPCHFDEGSEAMESLDAGHVHAACTGKIPSLRCLRRNDNQGAVNIGCGPAIWRKPRHINGRSSAPLISCWRVRLIPDMLDSPNRAIHHYFPLTIRRIPFVYRATYDGAMSRMHGAPSDRSRAVRRLPLLFGTMCWQESARGPWCHAARHGQRVNPVRRCRRLPAAAR